jgi:hypothetical protein
MDEILGAPATPAPHARYRLARTFLKCVRLSGGLARVYYQTSWFLGEEQSKHRGGEQVLTLTERNDGWRIINVDFTGEGIGQLAVPEPAWAQLKNLL